MQTRILSMFLILAAVGGSACDDGAGSGVGALAGARTDGGPPAEAPRLQQATPISLEALQLFGPFFHRKRQFPELREFTDVAVVKLNRSLEEPEQEARDFNLFALDGSQGVLLFSVGLKRLGAQLLPSLKGASQITVLANGRIGAINAAGFVDLCTAYGNKTVTVDSSCSPLSLRAKRIAASGSDDFLVITESGDLVNIDAVDGEQESIMLPVADLTELHSDGEFLAVAYNGGRSLAVFQNKGGHCFDEWETWRACQKSAANPGHVCQEERQAWQTCKRSQPGNHTVRFKFVEIARKSELTVPYAGGQSEPILLSGITRNGSGYYYIVTGQFDSLLALGPDLETVGIVYHFPQWPRPLRRVVGVRGVKMAPASGLVHIFSREAIESFSERPRTLEDGLRNTPSELAPIYAAIDRIPRASFDADRSQDLTTRPEIKALILDALDNLALE
jgi:hypothetical protein